MTTDTTGAKIVRGMVRTVFIGCYAAFMWASIHHVATFFDNFEQNGTSDTFGSYLLAGAIDITALVTTIGVMFFRKSMPRSIQIILWIFIIGLALYSFFINWEYASHYQNTTLILQPTGETTPVLDAHGNVHYVPVMVEQTWLLYINPALASCFTIFALIYSVVGEFFGAKPPTVAELEAKKKHLSETAGLIEEIKKLEEKGKGPGWIERGKQTALELKAAANELRKSGETEQETKQESTEKPERITDELEAISGESLQETDPKDPRYAGLSEEESMIASYYPDSLSWLSESGSTVSLEIISNTMNVSMKRLHNRVASKQIKQTRNKEIVFKDSVISWAITELLPVESQKTIQMKALKREPETTEQSIENSEEIGGETGVDKLNITVKALQENPDITDEELTVLLHLSRSASARFWRLKANEILRIKQTVNA